MADRKQDTDITVVAEALQRQMGGARKTLAGPAGSLKRQLEEAQKTLAGPTGRLAKSLSDIQLGDALRSVFGDTGSVAALSRSVAQLPTQQLRTAYDTAKGPGERLADAVCDLERAELSSGSPSPVEQSGAAVTHALPLLRDVSDLGALVRARRKAMGQSQQHFADLAGVGRRFLSELEQGKDTVEMGKALKVAAAAGLQIMVRAGGSNR